MQADTFEWRDAARDALRATRGATVWRRRTIARSECLDALDDHLAAVEQHLADANDTGEQQRHVEMDERRRPMDPRDGTETGRGT